MRAVRSRSSIREFELVVVACPPPPSSPDLFFRPRRRKPAMIDSSLCSSRRRRREEGEASHDNKESRKRVGILTRYGEVHNNSTLLPLQASFPRDLFSGLGFHNERI